MWPMYVCEAERVSRAAGDLVDFGGNFQLIRVYGNLDYTGWRLVKFKISA